MTLRFRSWFVLSAVLLAACGPGEPPPAASPTASPPGPIVVVGIDGGEWSVIRDLWSQGRLPHLRALADRGLAADLATNYSASPVIWTTIATGMNPAQHGITDFVVPSADGDVPVSSTVRRAPALWNMLTQAKRRTAVLGWWASWPAEEIDGLVISDRALLDVPRRVHPAGFLPELESHLDDARIEGGAFGGNPASEARDQVMSYWARRLVDDDYDLLLAYFRSVDIASHNHWKHYRPDDFAADDRPDDDEIAAHQKSIPEAYEAVDRALGRIVAAAPAEANVLVISDHGFEAAKQEIVKVGLDFDRVLERLGYLQRTNDQVDPSRSSITSHSSPPYRASKWLRFRLRGRDDGGRVEAGQRAGLRARLADDLDRITFDNGEKAFRVRDPRRREARRGADFVVEVLVDHAGTGMLLDGDPQPLAGLITGVSRVSGTHGNHTDGIFLAAGPDIDPDAEVAGLRIHDVTPTLLYGLGLPVAENFAGRAWTELFTADFRDAHPLRSIASWHGSRSGEVSTSAEDEELVEELRALGYLD